MKENNDSKKSENTESNPLMKIGMYALGIGIAAYVGKKFYEYISTDDSISYEEILIVQKLLLLIQYLHIIDNTHRVRITISKEGVENNQTVLIANLIKEYTTKLRLQTAPEDENMFLLHFGIDNRYIIEEWLEKNKDEDAFIKEFSKITIQLIEPIFNTGEHMKMGDIAYNSFYENLKKLNHKDFLYVPKPKKLTKTCSKVNPLSFGDIVAMAGDFFGIYNKPICEGKTIEDKEARFMEAFNTLFNHDGMQLANKLKCVNEKSPFSNLVYGIKCFDLKAINSTNLIPTRYLALALNNVDHFAPDAHDVYKVGHQLAMKKALQAHKCTDKKDKKVALCRAFQIEAFACHYLTDSFAAGHIRVPRRKLRDLGKQGFFSSAKFNSLAKQQHDEDGEYGLWVQDDSGNKWKAFGDGHLLPKNSHDHDKDKQFAFDKVCQAAHRAIEDIWNTFITGKEHNYVYKLIPKLQSDVNFAPLFKETKDDLLKRKGGIDSNEYEVCSKNLIM